MMIRVQKRIISFKMDIIIALLYISAVNVAYVRGSCSWPFKEITIADTAVNQDIFNYTTTEEFVFKEWEVPSADGGLNSEQALAYFEQVLENQTLYVKTTSNFSTINNDAYTGGQEILSITILITLTCDGADTESFLIVLVNNTNQNAPVFPQENYSFLLPMPIMPKTDFSLYGSNKIIATDIDFDTTQIIFSIDSEDFTVTSSKIENKKFQAVFSANKILRLNKSKIYTLTAMDSGSAPKSVTVPITLEIDAAAGLDLPSFSSAYYSYNCTYGGNFTLILSGEDIVVHSDKFETAMYSLNGAYSELFTVEYTNISKVFNIGIKPNSTWPPGNLASSIILTLSYTTDLTVSAAILINLVDDSSPPPEFSRDFYTGTYNIDTNNIKWNSEISVMDRMGCVVELSGNNSVLFTLNDTSLKPIPKQPLTVSNFDANSNLILILTASSVSGITRTSLVISLPKSELRFNEAYYYATYEIQNETGVVSLDSNMGFIDLIDFNGISITVDNSFSNNFKMEVQLQEWKVIVLQNLNSTTLQASSELVIPITATDGNVQSTACLIIKLPKLKIEFTHSYYVGEYIYDILNHTGSVVLDNNITLEGIKNVDIGSMHFTVNGYEENFQLVYSPRSSVVEIYVKHNLNQSTLDSESQIVTSILVTDIDETFVTSSVIVLNLPPKKSSLKFESTYYSAEYIVDDESHGSVKLTSNSIRVTGGNFYEISFVFEGYNDNFVMFYHDASSFYTIDVIRNLNASILSTESQLAITIWAFRTDEKVGASTVLMLTLPNKDSFGFERNYYVAKYIIDEESQAANIKFISDGIIIQGLNHKEINFTFEDYNNYFHMVYDSAFSEYVINVTRNLNATTLDLNSQLIMTINAIDTDENVATTVFVLILSGNTSLKFKNTYYSAEYVVDTKFNEDKVIFVNGGIIVDGGNIDELTFDFEGYNDYFEMEYDAAFSAFKVNVKSNLNSSTLLSDSQLIITITAMETGQTGTTNTILVLKLPSRTSSIGFDHTYYMAEYILDERASVRFTSNGINIIGGNYKEITFAFDGYSDNFDVAYDSAFSAYKIIVKMNLNSSILATKSQLIITIAAIKTGETVATNTVLVLKLPDKTSLMFKDTYYSAEYNIDTQNKADIKFKDNRIKEVGGNPQEINFIFEGHEENFDLAYNRTL